MKKSFLFIFVIIVLQISCKDSGTDPQPKNNPPGWQEDILWPSLANSPWPMYRSDPQNTGRSKWSGALSNMIDWSIDSIYNKAGASIGEDSTVYFLSTMGTTGLYSLKNDGSLKWVYQFTGSATETICSPIVSSDGTIYTSSLSENKFFAINPDGTLKWELNNISIHVTGNSLGKDGTLYLFGAENNGTLHAVSSAGNILWSHQISSNYGDYSSLALSPDSKSLYLIGSPGKKLISFDIVGLKINWSIQNDIINNPVVDYLGNIYITRYDIDNKIVLECIKPDGTNLWEYKTEEDFCTDVALDKYGTIYLGFRNIYAIDYKGDLLWKKAIENNFTVSSPITIDKNNNIYYSCNSSNGSTLFMLSKTGELNWQREVSGLSGYTNIISYNSLIIPTYHSNYIIKIK